MNNILNEDQQAELKDYLYQLDEIFMKGVKLQANNNDPQFKRSLTKSLALILESTDLLEPYTNRKESLIKTILDTQEAKTSL